MERETDSGARISNELELLSIMKYFNSIVSEEEDDFIEVSFKQGGKWRVYTTHPITWMEEIWKEDYGDKREIIEEIKRKLILLIRTSDNYIYDMVEKDKILGIFYEHCQGCINMLDNLIAVIFDKKMERRHKIYCVEHYP